MAKAIYGLAIVAVIVTVVGFLWTMYVNLTNGILITILGWASSWFLLQLGEIVENKKGTTDRR